MSLAQKAQKIWLSAAQPYAKEREETFQKKKRIPRESKGSNLQYQKHINKQEREKRATYNIKNTIWIQIKMSNQ